MAERSIDPKLQELKDRGVGLYSISRLDAINQCLYGAYRTYKLKERGKQNVYGALGTRIHGALEKITNCEATEKDLLPAMQAELDDMELLGISFPKDRNGRDTIRNGWIADMTHFCKTYEAPKDRDFETEKLFIYQTPSGHYLIGYIDLEENLEDGTINIYDYKTSSLYNKEGMKEHGRQLVVYLLGEEQNGKKVSRVAWNFLKYCEISFMGKKTSRSKEETTLTKVIERKNVGAELSDYVEKKLYDAGYSEVDVEIYLTQFRQTGLLSDLPTEVSEQFELKPYICEYEVTENIKEECIDYIESTIRRWEALGEGVSEYPPRSFTKIQKNGKEVRDDFFCSQLCGHSNDCPYLHDFWQTLDQNKDEEEEDLF